MTNACQFPDPVGVGDCGRRWRTNEHITLYANELVYHGVLCSDHRRLLTSMVPEFGLLPVGARTKDAKRRAMYVGKSGKAFTAAQARVWLISVGEDVGRGAGRLSQAQLDRYAESH